MKLYRSEQGLARQEGDYLIYLDVPFETLDEPLATQTLANLAEAGERSRESLADALEAARWLPLVAAPSRFVIAGMNYKAHCEEIGIEVPDRLMYGFAPGTAANACGAEVLMPEGHDTQIDYEGEIGVVVGRAARDVDPSKGWEYVAGIVPLNDVSARDVQAARTREAVGQAKGFPTFKPFGPVFVTPDEFDDPNDLTIRTWVNGEQRQLGRTTDMIFPINEILAIVSAEVELLPGDVICTGTPGGVAHGGKFPYLSRGDRVDIEIEGLPRLSNRFV